MRSIARIAYIAYGSRRSIVKKLALKVVTRIEKGEYYSETLRKIFRDYHAVDVGLYTHGGCFRPYSFDRHTRIGRYCSISETAKGFNRNHPLNHKSMHAFFFNPELGICGTDTVGYIPLEIGNDVWIGHNAIVLPNVRKIGDGAVIAAGAVVNKDVPPYGVVVGNPSRVVRFRFDEATIAMLVESRWWNKSIEELKKSTTEFQQFRTSIVNRPKTYL